MTERCQRLCASNDIDEKGRGFRFAVRVGERILPAFAIRYDGKVHAYLNQCAHQSVELDWQHGKFFDAEKRFLVCATHGALYEPDTGACAWGRCAGRGLVPLKTEERGQEVMLISENGIHLAVNQKESVSP
jgi:nitrite reductase/ring-hydroxylating ferredoxin subunit